MLFIHLDCFVVSSPDRCRSSLEYETRGVAIHINNKTGVERWDKYSKVNISAPLESFLFLSVLVLFIEDGCDAPERWFPPAVVVTIVSCRNYFLPHCAEVLLLVKKLVTPQDVNINGVLLC